MRTKFALVGSGAFAFFDSSPAVALRLLLLTVSISEAVAQIRSMTEQGHCEIPIIHASVSSASLAGFAGGRWRLGDLLGGTCNEHHGNGLQSHGLDLAVPFRASRFRVQV
ncbi:MAG TPA: hypothetical protein VM735_02235 [Candidatus Kapabacteria bacterium]|nr:hypothetical protein [Candidatus Kapabacteria bacterium]